MKKTMETNVSKLGSILNVKNILIMSEQFCILFSWSECWLYLQIDNHFSMPYKIKMHLYKFIEIQIYIYIIFHLWKDLQIQHSLQLLQLNDIFMKDHGFS